MEFLFGLYVIALVGILFIGIKASICVTRRGRQDDVKRIADLQHWEYLRSLKKDGYE